jgi:hypothetical protein
MTVRQQQADVVARMRLDRRLRDVDDYDWRERRDDWGDEVARAEARDRALERGDSPLCHWEPRKCVSG